MRTVLRAEGIQKSFASGDTRITALAGVDLRLDAGQVSALLGPSGSGKTTLLLCLSLVTCADAGVITLNDDVVFRDGDMLVDPLAFRRLNIGFVFQKSNLVPFLTVYENVLLMLEITGTRGGRARAHALELLDALEVGHRAHAYPATLSGGEQQRVAIARALAPRPALILADEPTAALDSVRGRKAIELLRTMGRERGAAILVVTHDERMIDGFDVVFRMVDGRLAREVAPRSVSSLSVGD